MSKRYPVVYVEWVDASALGTAWQDRKLALKEARRGYTELYRTAGFLIDDSPDGITLALSDTPGPDHKVGGVWVLPRSAIRRIETWERTSPPTDSASDTTEGAPR